MNPQILIVEDEAIIAMDLKNQLLGHGYGVTDIAASHDAALHKAETKRPDLVLMDIRLKGPCDGIETAQHLNERFDVPVVFLSAYSDPDTLARVKGVGAYGHLVKPFRSEELRTTIEVVLIKHTLTKKLQANEERVRTTLASIGDAVVTIDAAGLVDYLNPVAESLTGWTHQEAKGREFEEVLELVGDTSGEPIQNPLDKALRKGEVGTLPPRTVLKSRSGQTYPVEDACTPILDPKGKISGAVLVFRDVTAKREMLDRITHQARHDALTGLINRREFERRLEFLFDHTLATGQNHALLYLDLDGFKMVNDSCGHQAGDDLLRQLANLMPKKLRQSDVLARLGGDEFGILLENCSVAMAEHLANMLVKEVRNFRFERQGRVFQVGASIGIVPVTRQHLMVEELLVAADTACYLAKEKGRNRVQIYKPGDLEVEHRREQSNWATRLNAALEHNQFSLHAQRIAPTQPRIVGTDQFYELLLRLKNPDGSLTDPMTFIPAAERYNLMPRIDRWVIQHTLGALAHYGVDKADHWASCYMINLSGASLSDKQLLEFISEALWSSKVPASRICFEITESVAVTQLHEARDLITALKNLGCRFALDDFGSGLSSFRYLKSFPVDFLKIDGHFIQQIHQPLDYALVESIQRIARVMGVKTIAEYVESQAVMEKLEKLGVDYVQGYCIHKPQALEAVLGQ